MLPDARSALALVSATVLLRAASIASRQSQYMEPDGAKRSITRTAVAPPCGRDRGEATEERRERRLQRGTRAGTVTRVVRASLEARSWFSPARRARDELVRRRRGPSAALRLGGYAATQLRHSDRGASGWRGGRERARVGRLGPERVVLTAVHARGASRPRGDVHETAFAAAVEALSRRRLCRARTPQRRFEFRRTQGVRGPRGRGRHETTERDGHRATAQP